MMKTTSIVYIGLITICFSLLVGCGSRHLNPGFNMSTRQAQKGLAQQREEQPSLVRPLVVLSGYADPGLAPHFLRNTFGEIFDANDIVGTAFPTAMTLDACRKRVIELVNNTFPSEDPNLTVEVDVIAHSMGGLVSRYAAMEIPGKPRLRIANLFTIATPHQGALISIPPSPDPRVRDMRSGSEFLETLDAAFPARDYEMTCYVRLGDIIVAPKAAAPPNYPLWWASNSPVRAAHMIAPKDPRILLDITLRIRGLPPITTEPAPPLPD